MEGKTRDLALFNMALDSTQVSVKTLDGIFGLVLESK